MKGAKLSSVAHSFSYESYAGTAGGAGIMPVPEPRASLDAMRREAELAVAASSLRVVAAEIRMSAMGLRAFIRNDGTPQARTIRKLTAWYTGRVATRGSEGQAEARAALTVLSGFYPAADRPRVVRDMVELMRRGFRASGMQPPPWLASLAADAPPSDEPG